MENDQIANKKSTDCNNMDRKTVYGEGNTFKVEMERNIIFFWTLIWNDRYILRKNDTRYIISSLWFDDCKYKMQ